MFVRKIVSALALTAMLGACAQTPTVWDKPGAGAQDFNIDKYACQKDALALGGAYVAYGVVSRVSDAGVFRNCMVARGWHVTKD